MKTPKEVPLDARFEIRSGVAEVSNLLRCYAVSDQLLPTLRRGVTLKMNALRRLTPRMMTL